MGVEGDDWSPRFSSPFNDWEVEEVVRFPFDNSREEDNH